MCEKTLRLGFFILLFLFAFIIVLPINLFFITPYEEFTKTISLSIILSIGFLFFSMLILSDDSSEKYTLSKKITMLLTSAIITTILMFSFKSTVINLITNISYFDIKLIANADEKFKTTQHYKDFEAAYLTKDPAYLHKYFKENGIDNFSEINDDYKYDLITYIKVLNDPVVNQAFKNIYEDGLITRNEYTNFKKFTIKNAKDIK